MIVSEIQVLVLVEWVRKKDRYVQKNSQDTTRYMIKTISPNSGIYNVPFQIYFILNGD